MEEVFRQVGTTFHTRIRRDGRRVVIERVGSVEPFSEVRELADEVEAEACYFERIGYLLQHGWWRVSTGRPLFSLETRSVAPELERQIEVERDLESLLVCADALQEAGDPRGRLVTLHHQWEITGDPGLEAEFDDHLRAHERALFGGFAFLPKEWKRCATFSWRHGFIDAIELEVTETQLSTSRIAGEVLAAVLACPVARFVRSLALYGTFGHVAPSILVSSGCRSVVDITFHDAPPDVSLLSRLPDLRSLAAACAQPNLVFDLPRLQELRLDHAAALAAASRSSWPGLRGLRIELELRLRRLDLEDLERLLSADRLPVLERLAILDTREHPCQAGLEPVVRPLLASGLLPRLTHLELRGHLTNQGIRTLADRREALAHLESLRIDPRRSTGREARSLLAELGAEQGEQGEQGA